MILADRFGLNWIERVPHVFAFVWMLLCCCDEYDGWKNLFSRLLCARNDCGNLGKPPLRLSLGWLKLPIRYDKTARPFHTNTLSSSASNDCIFRWSTLCNLPRTLWIYWWNFQCRSCSTDWTSIEPKEMKSRRAAEFARYSSITLLDWELITFWARNLHKFWIRIYLFKKKALKTGIWNKNGIKAANRNQLDNAWNRKKHQKTRKIKLIRKSVASFRFSLRISVENVMKMYGLSHPQESLSQRCDWHGLVLPMCVVVFVPSECNAFFVSEWRQ